MPRRSSRQRQQQPTTLGQPETPTASTAASAANGQVGSSTNLNEPASTSSASGAAVIARTTRSKRNQQSSPNGASNHASAGANGAAASTSTPEPASKSLGKRRAQSPPAEEAAQQPASDPAPKKRRTSSTSSTPATPVSYNLRPRGSASSSSSHVSTSKLNPANSTPSTTNGSPSAKMPRKGKGSQSANANSLRAKAAANAAIAAHGAASSSTGQHSSAHANQSPSGSSRRQRDAYIDAEDMIGLDDDLDDQDQDMAIEEAHNEDEEAEVQHAMQIIEAAEAGDQSHASDAGPREESASPDSSPEPDDMPLIGAGLDDSMQHDEHEDDDEEQVRDDGDDDDEEDDEIMPGQEGEMLDDEFDAPLTFDADGNPLGPAGGVPPEEGEGEDPESDNEMMEGEGGEGGLRAAVAAAAAADEGFGSFAASLRGYSGLMANMSGRLRTILASLKNRSDPSGRMAALQELSELLSMATEDTLAGYFSVDAFVKELITVLKGSGGGTNPQAAYGLGDDDEDDDYAMAQAIAAAADAEEANGGENQEEMQLLACRCLANLIEALPHSSHNIVSNGAVPVLCSKLIEITFIDLAEQTISTLEKLSEGVPSAIVREGGLSALLTYLDFFSTHVQRTALTAVAKCCHNLSLDCFNAVRDAVPTLRNVLSYPDRKLVEQACLAITGIVDSYRHHPDKLEVLLTADLLTAIAALLVSGSANSTIDSSTHPKILKLLSTAAKSSPEIAMSLIDMNIANTVYQLLTGINPPLESEGIQGIKRHLEQDDMLVLNNLVHRSKDVVQETLALVYELMPSLPKDGIFDPRAHMHRSSKTKVKKEDGTGSRSAEKLASSSRNASSTSLPDTSAQVARRSPTRSGRSTPVINDDGSISVKREEVTPAFESEAPAASTSSASASIASAKPQRGKEIAQERRIQLFTKPQDEIRKATIDRFCATLLPILLDVYSASIGAQIRTKTFQSMLKIVHFSSKEHLPTILTIVPMASFLASCFSSRDQLSLVIDALQMTELLLVKVPDTYQFYFRREGVLYEIERMAGEALVLKKKEKEKKASSSTSTPVESSASTPVPGTATPADDGGDSPDLGTRLAPLPAILSAPAKPLSPADAILQDSVTLRARHLVKMLTDSSSDGSAKADSSLQKIRALVQTLDNAAGLDLEAGQSAAEQALRDISALFASSNAMSSFEMQESGLIEGLLRFATGGADSQLSNETRRKLFMTAFMGGGSSDAAFTALVKRLQEALGRAEESEVVTALPMGGDSRQNPATMLARQLKIRLVAADDAGTPKTLANVIVSIHAIATFQAFNDYLRPRIASALAAEERARTGAAPSPGASSRLSGVLAAFAAATGMPAPELEAATAGLTAEMTAPAVPASATAPSAPQETSSAPAALERRRSSRLSARASTNNSNAESNVQASSSNASSSLSAQSAPTPPPAAESSGRSRLREEDDPEILDDGLDDPAEAGEERPVNFEVTSDGSRISASTPDGTRIATPNPATPQAGTSTSGAASSRLAVSTDRTTPAPSTASTPATSRSYAAALKSAPSDWHIEFAMDGKDISLDTTIFGAVYQHEVRSGNQLGSRGVWHNVYTVNFRKVPGAPVSGDDLALPEPSKIEKPLPEFLAKDPKQATVLRLLSVLHQVNSEWAETLGQQEVHDVEAAAALANNLFVNNKLTAKLNRQLEEPMIVASSCLPSWALELPTLFPFLFPFESRFVFLQSTSFGYARLMQKWLQSARTDTNARRDENLSFLGRLQRQKVRISRQRLFESAFKVFELYGSSKALLEVEYFDEVGTGLGPTLEFYSLVSKDFRRKSLGLWREGDSPPGSEYVSHSRGLFPAPVEVNKLDDAAWAKLSSHFKVLGTVVAKGLMDSRILDLPFSQMFMKLMLNQTIPLTIASVRFVDLSLAQSLEHIQKYADEKEAILAAEGISDEDKQAAIGGIEIDGAGIQDLSLDFTLPGYDVELKSGGKEIDLTMDNVEEYIKLVLDWTLVKGVKPMVQKFREGFSAVFPVRDLHSFRAEELVLLFGNEEEDWSETTIKDSIKADHGYSPTSAAIFNLVAILTTFDTDMRRKFLSFSTGAARLPLGGFGALNPPLTVVRKAPEDSLSADDILPSASTCANFFKLPDYSTRDIMRQRLELAVREGAGSFHLS